MCLLSVSEGGDTHKRAREWRGEGEKEEKKEAKEKEKKPGGDRDACDIARRGRLICLLLPPPIPEEKQPRGKEIEGKRGRRKTSRWDWPTTNDNAMGHRLALESFRVSAYRRESFDLPDRSRK